MVKLQIPAGKANPAPPVGPALGQHGVNIMEFCKGFNARTAAGRPDPPGGGHDLRGSLLHLHVKTPPASVLLKRAAGIAKGSANPPRQDRQGDPGAGRGDRPDEAARPEHGQRRPGDAHRRGDRSQHGPRSGGLGGEHGSREAVREGERVDRGGQVSRRGGGRPGSACLRQVRRDRRARRASRRRPEARRPDGTRHGGPPARHRQDGARAGLRQGREGARGARGRRGLRRCRGPGREDPGRLARLRHRGRDARHDGPGRAAREDPRAPRPHAEPEGRYRDLRRRRAVREVKAGKVEFKVDKAGNVHVPVGKKSFPPRPWSTNVTRSWRRW